MVFAGVCDFVETSNEFIIQGSSGQWDGLNFEVKSPFITPWEKVRDLKLCCFDSSVRYFYLPLLFCF
jgi:hypothetical protein